MNRNTVFNVILFVLLSALVLGGWWFVEKNFFPPKVEPAPETKPAPVVKPSREAMLAVTGGAFTVDEKFKEWPSKFIAPKPDAPKVDPKPDTSEPHRLISLGGEGFNKIVLLSSRGAGVQSVRLPAFDQASRLGEPGKDAEGKPYALELIPGYHRARNPATVKDDGEHRYLEATPKGAKQDPAGLMEPSYTMLHYEGDLSSEAHPSPLLAVRNWKVIEEVPGTDESEAKVVFETTLEAPYFLKIRKSFTLAKGEYHIKMKLEFTGLEGRPTDKTKAPLRYQIMGAIGLPLEGEWYTSAFRSAMVGWKTPSGSGKRDIQDSIRIATEHGGEKVVSNGNTFTYAAVVTQFFASALAIDPDMPEAERKKLWAYVRATREGTPPDEDKPQLSDITVRAVIETPLDPAAGATIEHRYWIYNGPTKVRLLKDWHLLEKDKQKYTVDTNLVYDKYIGDLALNTMTDAPTPNFFGKVAGFIGWTDLVIWFTNRMHDVLGVLHGFVPVWGVNILLLTVMVRLLLMIPSRRQQASMMKMQEKMALMKPEIDKVTEKYKNDPQKLQQEKTKLMLQSGVNPLSSLGGCLLMFAQMPVFLGLYYCLQESIFFRLDNFLWMRNLAAPDMLIPWSESIPWISTADNIGHTTYLGPFVNILPVVAVTLMFINFKVSSPPAQDEQQATQQKMMKYMMIVMGVFFYKMAAGMCVYFIVSTGWGLTERFFLKRKKAKAEAKKKEMEALGILPEPELKIAPKPPGSGFVGRMKQKLMDAMEEAQKKADTSRQIINNPTKPGLPPGPGPSGNGKKKKRKK